MVNLSLYLINHLKHYILFVNNTSNLCLLPHTSQRALPSPQTTEFYRTRLTVRLYKHPDLKMCVCSIIFTYRLPERLFQIC